MAATFLHPTTTHVDDGAACSLHLVPRTDILVHPLVSHGLRGGLEHNTMKRKGNGIEASQGNNKITISRRSCHSPVFRTHACAFGALGAARKPALATFGPMRDA